MSTTTIKTSGSLPDLFCYAEVTAVNNDAFATRYGIDARIAIYRFNQLIWHSKPFIWTLGGFIRVIGDIKLIFPEVPSTKNLRYHVIFVTWRGGRQITSRVQLNPVLSSNFASTKSGKSKKALKLTFSFPPKLVFSRVRILHSMKTRQIVRKNNLSRMPRVSSVVKAPLRPSPETRQMTYKITTSSSGGGTGVATNTVDCDTRTYTSVRTPNFRSLARHGNLPVNPYSMHRAWTSGGPLTIRKTTWTGGFSNQDNNILAYSSLADASAGHLPVDVNLVINKLAGKINSSQANIPEDLVQWKQTVGLFTNKAKLLTTALSLLHSGQPKKAAVTLGIKPTRTFLKQYASAKKRGLSAAKLVSEVWLELRYGWIPLIGDIQAALGTMSAILKRNPDTYTVTSGKTVNSEFEEALHGIASTCGTCPVIFKHHRITTSLKMSVTYQFDNHLLNLAAGLGFTAPVALAWELLPYSFVVDWFLPIGQALQAFSAFEGLTFKRGYKTYFTNEKTVVVANYSGSDATWSSEKYTGSGLIEGVTMSRVVLTDFPSPGLPQFKNPFSAIHAANAAALLVAAFTRGMH